MRIAGALPYKVTADVDELRLDGIREPWPDTGEWRWLGNLPEGPHKVPRTCPAPDRRDFVLDESTDGDRDGGGRRICKASL
jgi:hypothetical protein